MLDPSLSFVKSISLFTSIGNFGNEQPRQGHRCPNISLFIKGRDSSHNFMSIIRFWYHHLAILRMTDSYIVAAKLPHVNTSAEKASKPYGTIKYNATHSIVDGNSFERVESYPKVNRPILHKVVCAKGGYPIRFYVRL